MLIYLLFNQKEKDKPTIETSSSSSNQISFPESKTITTENGTPRETQDKDVIFEGLSSVAAYDQWTPLTVSGPNPKPRYQVHRLPPVIWYFILYHDLLSTVK
jgi:flagellar hook-length control protein FliK